MGDENVETIQARPSDAAHDENTETVEMRLAWCWLRSLVDEQVGLVVVVW